MIGQQIHHYFITDKLGEGGMGVVYKAQDTKLNRTVALKFLPSNLTDDAEVRERFLTEARAASALDHVNVCTIHEVNSTDDGAMFIAMVYYDGPTLKQRVRDGPIPLLEALDLCIQIASALRKAHQQGIIHRDIKPANILIARRRPGQGG